MAASEASWEDIVACERTVVRFSVAFDGNDLDGMLAEFAVDGVWHRQDGVIQGHDGIRAMMAVRPPGLFVRHLLSNQCVTVAADGSATCVSYLTVYRDDDGGAPPAPLGRPSLVGRYHDGLTKAGGRWKLASRRVSVDFK